MDEKKLRVQQREALPLHVKWHSRNVCVTESVRKKMLLGCDKRGTGLSNKACSGF